MAQMINIHVGQAGCQIGSAVWELYCLEHSIQPDGNLPAKEDVGANLPFSLEQATMSQSAKLVPRSLFVDTDPCTIDQIRTGTYRHLFNKDWLISSNEGSLDNFARGHYNSRQGDKCMDQVRRIVETCEALKGFTQFASVGGGTGSGLGALISEMVARDYSKVSRSAVAIWVSPQMANGVLENFNAMLALESLKSKNDSCLLLDNEALYGLCRRNLDMEQPSTTSINRLIAQLTSSCTASLRFDGKIGADISEFGKYLVPSERGLNFLIPSFGPAVAQAKSEEAGRGSLADLTGSMLKSKEMMLTCDLESESARNIASCLMYRGDIVPKDVVESVATAKKSLKFADWVPNGGAIKCSITDRPSVFVPSSGAGKVPRTLCTVSNNSAVVQAFDHVGRKFDMMYAKRAFVHWYIGEGMEEGEFSESREGMSALVQDYKDAQ